MPRFLVPISTAFALTAAPSWADLTAQSAWDAFQANYGLAGTLSVEAETVSGSTLTASGVVLEFAPDEETSGNVVLGVVEFRERGDGTVDVVLEDSLPMVMAVEIEGESVTIRGDITLEGGSIVYSGTPEDVTQTYAFDTYGFVLTGIDEMPGEADVMVEAVGTNVSGVTNLKLGEVIETTFTLAADSFGITVDATSPDNETVQAQYTLENIAGEGAANFPENMATIPQEELVLDPNYLVDITTASASTTFSFMFDGADDDASIEFSAADAGTSMTLIDQAFRVANTLNALDVSVLTPDLPIPLNVAAAEIGFDFGMPLAMTEEDREIVLGTTLRDLVLDSFIWNIFDPAEVLPRDPATVSFLVEAQGRWLIDLMGMEDDIGMGLMPEGPPVALSEATISGLEVTAAGASLTGQGGFTFDNDDLETFDGFPAPTGAIDLTLRGGNALIDRLVQMGLVPQDQAMGARMMLGIFMVPGAGDDTLTSRIEVEGNGQISANGQRLR